MVSQCHELSTLQKKQFSSLKEFPILFRVGCALLPLPAKYPVGSDSSALHARQPLSQNLLGEVRAPHHPSLRTLECRC